MSNAGKLQAVLQSLPQQRGCGSVVDPGLELHCHHPIRERERERLCHKQLTSSSSCLHCLHIFLWMLRLSEAIVMGHYGSLFCFSGAAMIIHRLGLNNGSLYFHCSRGQKLGIMESVCKAHLSRPVSVACTWSCLLSCVPKLLWHPCESRSPVLTATAGRWNRWDGSPWGFPLSFYLNLGFKPWSYHPPASAI